MPTNEIRVETAVGQPLKCSIWDGLGAEHDITGIFEQLKDQTTKTRQSAEISLGSSTNTLYTSIRFEALKRELLYEVSPAVVAQILEMKP